MWSIPSLVTVFISWPHIISSNYCNQTSAYSLSKVKWRPSRCNHESVSVLLFFTSLSICWLYYALLQGSHIDAVQSQCYLLWLTLLIAIYHPAPQLHNIRTSLSLRFPVFTNWNQLCIANLRRILSCRSSLFKPTLFPNLNNFISSFKFIFSSASAGTTTLRQTFITSSLDQSPQWSHYHFFPSILCPSLRHQCDLKTTYTWPFPSSAQNVSLASFCLSVYIWTLLQVSQ